MVEERLLNFLKRVMFILLFSRQLGFDHFRQKLLNEFIDNLSKIYPYNLGVRNVSRIRADGEKSQVNWLRM